MQALLLITRKAHNHNLLTTLKVLLILQWVIILKWQTI